MTISVKQLYEQLAVRINYPITPTFRCLSKVIGYINLLLSYTSTTQLIEKVELLGEPDKRYYEDEFNNRIEYLENGPCNLNPDGTIRTKDTYGYIVHKSLFRDQDGNYINYVSTETDVLTSDLYLQPFLTSLFLLFNGVSPDEASMYINQSCFKNNAGPNMQRINLDNVRRRL